MKGTVDSSWKKEKAELAAYDIFGAVEVINQLSVVPTKNIADQVIAEQITTALGRNTDVDEDRIDIQVENGHVVLSGSVPNWNMFRSAFETALYTPGVISVDNKLSLRKD